MRSDYKIAQILRPKRGAITVLTRFYEGELRLVNLALDDPDGAKGLTSTDKIYERFLMLREVEFAFIHGTTNEEIRRFLNIELDKDKTREPIDEQKNSDWKPRENIVLTALKKLNPLNLLK